MFILLTKKIQFWSWFSSDGRVVVDIIIFFYRGIVTTIVDPNITLHTTAQGTETLRPNLNDCYDLEVAMEEAYSSKEYHDRFWEKNKRARALAETMMGIDAHPRAGVSIQKNYIKFQS